MGGGGEKQVRHRSMFEKTLLKSVIFMLALSLVYLVNILPSLKKDYLSNKLNDSNIEKEVCATL